MASSDPVYDDFVKQCRLDDQLAAAIAANSNDGELVRSVNLEQMIGGIYEDEVVIDIIGTTRPAFCPVSLGDERLERAVLAARDLMDYDPEEFPSLEYLKARFRRDLERAVRFQDGGNLVLKLVAFFWISFSVGALYLVYLVMHRLGNF